MSNQKTRSSSLKVNSVSPSVLKALSNPDELIMALRTSEFDSIINNFDKLSFEIDYLNYEMVSNIMFVIHYNLLSVSYQHYRNTIRQLIAKYHNHRYSVYKSLMRNPLSWFFASPYIGESKQYITNYFENFYYSILCQLLFTETDYRPLYIHDGLDPVLPKTIYYWPMRLLDILHSNITAAMGSSSLVPMISTQIECKRAFIEKMVPFTPLQGRIQSQDAVIVVDKLISNSSDVVAMMPFVDALRRIYKVHVITVRYDNERKFDDYFASITVIDPLKNFSDFDKLLTTQYTVALYVNNLYYMVSYLAKNRLAHIQIGILGHIQTSCIYDYFVVPNCDIPENYTERLLYVSGMACGLPSIHKSSLSHKEHLSLTVGKVKSPFIKRIFVALTGFKINTNTGPYLRKIVESELMSDFRIIFMIHLGAQQRPVQSIVNLMIAEYLEPNSYEVYANDPNAYYYCLSIADVVLTSFPYSPYISMCDIIYAGKPVVVQTGYARNSENCASRIAQYFGINTITDSEETSIELLSIILHNKWQDLGYILSIDRSVYDMKLIAHNETIADEFEGILRSLIN